MKITTAKLPNFIHPEHMDYLDALREQQSALAT